MYLTLLMLVSVLSLIYLLLCKKINYWKNRGISGPRPYPLVGNFGDIIIGKRGANQIYNDIYREYEGHAFVGAYKFMIPVLLVRDPDLMKCILVRNFSSFQRNDVFANTDIDPIYSRNLFVSEGSVWKTRRTGMMSCLSLSKIRYMYSTMEKNSRNMVVYIDQELKKYETFNIGEIFEKFIIDTIAACGLGVEENSFDEDISVIKKIADRILDNGGVKSFLTALWMHMAPLSKFIKLRIISPEEETIILSIMRSTLKYRRDDNIYMNDYLQAAADIVRAQTLSADYNMAAHITSLFIDGYLSSANTMAFLVYELACNTDIQEKLRVEVTECYNRNGGKFDYKDTMKLKYLDACIHESLRKHSIVPVMGKICTEKFTYTPTNPEYKNTSITIEPGTSVVIPAFAIHHDQKFFEEPEKYMPERFMNENSFNKSNYLGFGIGQRKCTGIDLRSRFALTQMKIGLAHFLKNFKFRASPQMRVPLNYDPWFIILSVRGGVWVEIQRIPDE